MKFSWTTDTSIYFAVIAVELLSYVELFVTLWTVDHQSPLSMGFLRQEYWRGLPFPPLGDLPHPGIESESLASADGFFPTELLEKFC